MKAAVSALRFFQAISGTGLRGRMLSRFFSGVLKLTRPRGKVIDSNLKLAYPDSSEQWRKNLRAQVYEGLGWTLAESFALQREPSQALSWVKSIKRKDILDWILSRKQGVIYLTAHFGNWELFGSWYGQYARAHDRKFYAIYQELHDEDISRYVQETRKHAGINLLTKDISVLKLSRMIRDGTDIALLNDVSGTGKLIVPFMGHDATNMAGPAFLAMLTNAPVVPVCLYRLAPFEHEAEFFEPLKLPDKSVGREERMRAIVLEINRAIEVFIRRRPELWFWLHKRWRP